MIFFCLNDISHLIEFLTKTIFTIYPAKEMDVPDRIGNYQSLFNWDRNFYDFVTIYHIEYAKDILKDPSKIRLAILEILYEVDFNSKSSFNTAFKKHTASIPTEPNNYM